VSEGSSSALNNYEHCTNFVGQVWRTYERYVEGNATASSMGESAEVTSYPP